MIPWGTFHRISHGTSHGVPSMGYIPRYVPWAPMGYIPWYVPWDETLYVSSHGRHDGYSMDEWGVSWGIPWVAPWVVPWEYHRVCHRMPGGIYTPKVFHARLRGMKSTPIGYTMGGCSPWDKCRYGIVHGVSHGIFMVSCSHGVSHGCIGIHGTSHGVPTTYPMEEFFPRRVSHGLPLGIAWDSPWDQRDAVVRFMSILPCDTKWFIS